MLLTALITSLVLSAAAPQKYDATLEGEIDNDSVTATYTQLKTAYDADKKEAWLYIDSPGGEVFAMLQFTSHVKDLKKYGMKIVCVADVMAASAASMIYEDICDVRIVTPGTVILFHEAAGMIGGKETNMADGLKLMQIIDEMVDNKIAPRLHLAPEEYRAHVRGRDWFLSSNEVVELFGADKVMDSQDLPTLLDPPASRSKPADLKPSPPPSPVPNETPQGEPSKISPAVQPMGEQFHETVSQRLLHGAQELVWKVRMWLATIDWQKTAMWTAYGLLGLVALWVWIKSILDKRKAKKAWLAAKAAKLKAENEARQAAVQAALDSIKKKTKKAKKNGA